MNNKYSLLSFFNEIKNGNENLPGEIVIPRIQRAYAQGRKNEKFVREGILDDIFHSLLTGETLELNFIYGTLIDKKDHQVFEILDGQQRTTTLWLLQWYIACRENHLTEDLSKLLGVFRYETRHTSTDFCNGLSRYHYVHHEGETPSENIRKQLKWYFKSFDLDPTVDSMLVMLNAIDEKYNKVGKSDLYAQLENIQFYVLRLDKFKLTEELYIKMNARGLSLTPFENFKADLINYMKTSGRFDEITEYNGRSIPYYLKIASEIDGKWVDLFWDNNDYETIDSAEYIEDNEDYNVKYFRFFYRYFASTYILKYALDVKSDPMRQDKMYLFFHQVSESQKLNNYLRFDHYKTMLDAQPDHICNMEKILDTLYDHYEKDIKPLLTPVWNKNEEEKEDSWDFYSIMKPTGFNLQRRIIFAAICEFIEAYETFDLETFGKWMRVVWNVVSNTDIDSISALTVLERSLSGIIRGAAQSQKEFYHYLSEYSSKANDEDSNGERSGAIQEEIIKARYIISDDRWLPLFLEAEQHPFCKGMVRFFLKAEGDTPEIFAHRYATVKNMFDEKGVTAEYSEEGDYILLRSLISRITNWENFNNRYFTDKVEKKYNALKIMLTTPNNQPLRDFMCDVLDKPTKGEMLSEMYKAVNEPSHLNLDAYWDVDRKRLIHERLYQHPEYERWIQANGAWRVYWRYSNYYSVETGSSYNLILLDTNRNEFIKQLMLNDGFTLIDENIRGNHNQTQVEDFKKYGIFFGYRVPLLKEYRGWQVRVNFSYNNLCYISVIYDGDIQELNNVFGEANVREVENTNPKRYQISEAFNYEKANYDEIKEKIFSVLDKLPQSENVL